MVLYTVIYGTKREKGAVFLQLWQIKLKIVEFLVMVDGGRVTKNVFHHFHGNKWWTSGVRQRLFGQINPQPYLFKVLMNAQKVQSKMNGVSFCLSPIFYLSSLLCVSSSSV